MICYSFSSQKKIRLQSSNKTEMCRQFYGSLWKVSEFITPLVSKGENHEKFDIKLEKSLEVERKQIFFLGNPY